MLTGPPSSISQNSPILQNAPATLPPTLLADGARLLTTVRGSAETPFLLLGSQRVPIQQGSGLQPGDTVRVTLLLREGTPRFEIAREATSAPPKPADALGTLLTRLGEMAGKPVPGSLVPPQFPAGDSVRQLVQLFQQHNDVAPGVARLAEQLRVALPSGHPVLAQISSILEHFGSIFASDPAQIAARLKALTQRRAPEASLLAASPAELAALAKSDLASLLVALQGDDALLAALRDSGQLDDFVSATTALLERLDGARAQQLHGQSHGYVYLELPLPSESGFAHAAVHFFHEGTPRPDARAELPAVAVLDLELSGLGPVWISLRAHGGTCTCEMLATTPEAQQLLEAERATFTAALQEAGFQRAEVRAGKWNGDRLAQTADLLGTLRPLDLSA